MTEYKRHTFFEYARAISITNFELHHINVVKNYENIIKFVKLKQTLYFTPRLFCSMDQLIRVVTDIALPV